MIVIDNISKYLQKKRVIDQVSLELTRGEVIGLVGPSGAGKSVLLKIIGGIIAPDDGLVFDFEKQHDKSDKNGSNNRENGSQRNTLSGGGANIRIKAGFLFQEGGLFDSMTVLENVAFPLISGGSLLTERTSGGRWTEQQAREKAASVLVEVGLEEALQKVPGQLSGGMKRRAGIARALVSDPELLLLDDPTGGLDPVTASVIMNLVLELHQKHDCTVLMVSHDIRRLLPRVERTLCLFDGKLIYDGPTTEIVQKAPIEAVKFLARRFDFASNANLSGATNQQGAGEQ